MEIDDLLRQDDYQQVMHRSNATLHCTHILGSHELDLAYHWDNSWLGFSFDYLLSWLSHTKDITPPPSYAATPVDITSLSQQQLQALRIISDHMFGATQQHHLLIIVVGTAGTGKSYLINTICFLFAIHIRKTRSCFIVTFCAFYA